MTTKTWDTKQKMDELDVIKITISCVSKDIIKNVKRWSTEWEKILGNYLIRVRYPKYISNSYNSREKWPTAFLQRRYTKSQQACEKMWSTSLVTREVQSKSIMRYRFTPTRLVIVFKITSTDKDAEELESSYIAGRNVTVKALKKTGGSSKS